MPNGALSFAVPLCTAFRQKKLDEFPQNFELGHAVKRTALSNLSNQSHRNQPVDVVRQGGTGYAEFCLDLSHRCTFTTDFHQVAKNR